MTTVNLTSIISQICTMDAHLSDLLERVDSLEHYSNQVSILLDTLGNIMEELKKQEH